MKNYQEINVYDAAIERINYLLDEFDHIMIAFSGGKDSTVCLHLLYDQAKRRNELHKIAMYHLDYEAQYQMTTDHVTEMFEEHPDIERYWLCLPVKAQCACSMTSDHWIPWEKKKSIIWVRQMPQYPYVINEDNCPFEFCDWDYTVQDNFCDWYAQTHSGKSAFVIGLRADESLNRFRSVSEFSNAFKYDGKNWINSNKAYPIYDWRVEDIWTYFGKTGYSYNRLYNLFYQAGMTLSQMRVASPFNDCAGATLKYYKVIDPQTWGMMISRVNGVGFVGLYGDTKLLAWQKIKKPRGMTWKQYCNFLLNTLDEDTRNHYLAKLNTSIKFWREKGGAISEESVDYLQKNNIPHINHGRIKSGTQKDVVAFPDYLDDAQTKNFKELPTYKRMCICIMKNDFTCKYMGFSQTKAESEKRKKAIEKYANIK